MQRKIKHLWIQYYARAKRYGFTQKGDAFEICHGRLAFAIIIIIAMFFTVAGKMVQVSVFPESEEAKNAKIARDNLFKRAEIVDRNGLLLATNLLTYSIYANPSQIKDPVSTVRKLAEIFPELNKSDIYNRMASNRTFIWVKRNITPKEQFAVNNLGLVGVYFQQEEKRIYPYGPSLAHIVGYVGLDNKGLSGIEQYFDKALYEKYSRNNPLQLAIDARVQNILHDELATRVEEFKAIGGSGLVMDANTGEVIAMVSLPDFDPHDPGNADSRAKFNQITLGVYEMGSIFKTITMALGLNSGAVTFQDSFDITNPIKIARFTIKDFHAEKGFHSVPEIFMNSSNIGTAKIALKTGTEQQQNFLKELGLLSALEIELPEKSAPLFPSKSQWKELSTMTISYGHGIAVTPLHMSRAIAALINGGELKPVTLLKQESEPEGVRVVSAKTSEQIRQLMRLVVTNGTGRKAKAEGYLVGGKSGSAEKLSGKGYSKKANLSSFVGMFPANDPKYIVMAVLDEPKGNASTGGYSTGGAVAAPVVGATIARIGPILGIEPIDENSESIGRQMWVDYQLKGISYAAH